jgi:hypothetical protein
LQTDASMLVRLEIIPNQKIPEQEEGLFTS